MWTNCPACPGKGYLLGALGRTKHYCCRDCGATYSKQARSARKPK